jgi:hypothetical protein
VDHGDLQRTVPATPGQGSSGGNHWVNNGVVNNGVVNNGVVNDGVVNNGVVNNGSSS